MCGPVFVLLYFARVIFSNFCDHFGHAKFVISTRDVPNVSFATAAVIKWCSCVNKNACCIESMLFICAHHIFILFSIFLYMYIIYGRCLNGTALSAFGVCQWGDLDASTDSNREVRLYFWLSVLAMANIKEISLEIPAFQQEKYQLFQWNVAPLHAKNPNFVRLSVMSMSNHEMSWAKRNLSLETFTLVTKGLLSYEVCGMFQLQKVQWIPFKNQVHRQDYKFQWSYPTLFWRVLPTGAPPCVACALPLSQRIWTFGSSCCTNLCHAGGIWRGTTAHDKGPAV